MGVGEDDRIEADAVVSGDVGETPAQDDPLVRWIARADSHSRRRKRVSFVLCNGVGLVDPARGPARVGSGFAHGRKCSRGADSPGVRGRHLATCPVWSVFTQWMPWPSVALTVAGGVGVRARGGRVRSHRDRSCWLRLVRRHPMLCGSVSRMGLRSCIFDAVEDAFLGGHAGQVLEAGVAAPASRAASWRAPRRAAIAAVARSRTLAPAFGRGESSR